jgi:hypothetical protein
MHGNRGTRLTLLSYRVAKTRLIGGAAVECSNQADLHLTFTDPIWPPDLPQRSSLTSMPRATDQIALQQQEDYYPLRLKIDLRRLLWGALPSRVI